MPVARKVIVDDTDPQIQYSSIDQWRLLILRAPSPSAFDPLQPQGQLPFQNTTHVSSNQTTSSLSLQFQGSGSSPQVFGTNSSPGTPYECFIDGTSIGSTSPTGAFVGLLCDGTPFVEGKEYTLTLNVTQKEGFQGIGFDYITYIPSTSVPLGSATVLVDRGDPAIAYGILGWNFDTSGQDDLDSFTQTNDTGLTFNFTGTSVSWVGSILHLGPANQSISTGSATYSIDEAEPVPFELHTPPVVNYHTNNSTTQVALNLTNQVFFTSPTLSPGPHSLKVTYEGNQTAVPLALNHFVVANNVSTTSPSANRPSTSAPIGAIVGGVIGGIAVLCLAAFLLRRRSRQWKTSRKRSSIDHDDTTTFPHLTPFDAMPSGPAMAEASNRTLKAHRPLMVDPPEFDPYILFDRPSGIDGVDATPRAQHSNQPKPPLRIPPVEAVHEDHSARSATSDEAADPPPSYAS
ncbi:hypothetical protein BD779DRAFT_1099478 [Infundibulicybe gibba]|nr:hypothetical protein BD779DRAFT_1099478 [Infundibulicybe gibba]